MRSPAPTPMKRPYAARLPSAERKVQILEAAVAEYLDKGFVGARVDSIAEAIGVSKPVLYGAFESKDAISTAVVEEVHRREVLDLMSCGIADDFEQLQEGRVEPLFETIFKYAVEQPKICRFLYSNFSGAPPEAVEFHDQVFDLRVTGLAHHLAIFFEADEESDEKAYLTGEMISGVGRRGMFQLARAQMTDASWLAKQYGSLIERGIASS